jgi:hypothetical protein
VDECKPLFSGAGAAVQFLAPGGVANTKVPVQLSYDGVQFEHGAMTDSLSFWYYDAPPVPTQIDPQAGNAEGGTAVTVGRCRLTLWNPC